MKIAVLSMYINPWYREIVKYAKQNLEEYCTLNGYDFIYETEETLNGVYDGLRDPPWYKIKLILKTLENYDYVVWEDADSFIFDYNKKLEYFIDKYLEDKDILVATDNDEG